MPKQPGRPEFAAQDLERLLRLLQGDSKLTEPRDLHAANVRTGLMLRRQAGTLSGEDLRALLAHSDPEIRELALRAFAGLGTPNLRPMYPGRGDHA